MVRGLVFAVVMVLLVVASISQLAPDRPPPPPVFNPPTRDDPHLRDWAGNALQAFMSFSFSDHGIVRSNARQYFSPEGLQKYNEALEKSGMIAAVEAGRQNVKLSLRCRATITGEAHPKGIPVWRVEVGAEQIYTANGKGRIEPVHVTLVVRASKSTRNPHGFAIDQVVMVPGSGGC